MNSNAKLYSLSIDHDKCDSYEPTDVRDERAIMAIEASFSSDELLRIARLGDDEAASDAGVLAMMDCADEAWFGEDVRPETGGISVVITKAREVAY